jgi:hypothetical protein
MSRVSAKPKDELRERGSYDGTPHAVELPQTRRQATAETVVGPDTAQLGNSCFSLRQKALRYVKAFRI